MKWFKEMDLIPGEDDLKAGTQEDTTVIADTDDGSSAETENADINRTDKVADGKIAEEQSVPYPRFKEVNDNWRKTEAELNRALGRLEALEKQAVATKPNPSQNAEEPLAKFDDPYEQAMFDKMLGALEKKFAKATSSDDRELLSAQIELETNIAVLRSKYPKLDRKRIINDYLAEGNSLSLDELAGKYAKETEAEEKTNKQKIIDEYLADKKKDGEHVVPKSTGKAPAASDNKELEAEKKLPFFERLPLLHKRAMERLKSLKD